MTSSMNELNITIYEKIDNKLAVAEASNISDIYGGSITNKKVYYFNRINVPKDLRGKGIGTKLLNELLKIAEENGIAIMCDINPYGDLTYEELYNWYTRHGFEKQNNEYLWFNI